jgi:hypothetical protein
MDLTEFRATYPGLYDEAMEAGRETDRRRVEQLFALAEAAGSLQMARRPIENGSSVQDALPQLRSFASKDDARAAAFMRKLDELGLATRESGEPDLQTAQRLAAVLRGGARGGRDAGDIVADLMLGSGSGRAQDDSHVEFRAVGRDGTRSRIAGGDR